MCINVHQCASDLYLTCYLFKFLGFFFKLLSYFSVMLVVIVKIDLQSYGTSSTLHTVSIHL